MKSIAETHLHPGLKSNPPTRQLLSGVPYGVAPRTASASLLIAILVSLSCFASICDARCYLSEFGRTSTGTTFGAQTTAAVQASMAGMPDCGMSEAPRLPQDLAVVHTLGASHVCGNQLGLPIDETFHFCPTVTRLSGRAAIEGLPRSLAPRLRLPGRNSSQSLLLFPVSGTILLRV